MLHPLESFDAKGQNIFMELFLVSLVTHHGDAEIWILVDTFESSSQQKWQRKQ